MGLAWGPIARTLLRSLFSTVLLLVLYFTLPLSQTLDAGGIALLVAGLVVFSGAVAWQFRAIFRARYPLLKAIEALAIVIPLFLLTFSALYFELARNGTHVFTEPLTRVDALYFTVTVFATVGFGDIAAVTQTARVIVTVQMLGDLIVLGVLLRTVVSAVRVTRQYRSDTSAASQADPPEGPEVPAPSVPAPAPDTGVAQQ
jgi:hypothetical protein